LPNEGYLMKQKLDTIPAEEKPKSRQKLEERPKSRQNNNDSKKFLTDLMPNESMVDRYTVRGQGSMAIAVLNYRNA
jgi:hypothetical protein